MDVTIGKVFTLKKCRTSSFGNFHLVGGDAA